MKKSELKELEKDLEKQREQSKDSLYLNKMVEDNIISSEWGKSEKPFNVFSPSQVGYCKRQMYNRKMNLTSIDRYIQGILHAGTVNHFWLEHNLPELVEDRALSTERKFRKKIDIDEGEFDLYVSGYADAVDSEGIVYDHKFTGDPSYKEDEPAKKDKRQVMMYLYALPDIHTGQLEYVIRDGKFGKTEKNKPYIVVHQIQFDAEEFAETLQNMYEVAKKVRERDGTPREVVNPFDKCGCFYCDQEEFRDEVHEKQKQVQQQQ